MRRTDRSDHAGTVGLLRSNESSRQRRTRRADVQTPRDHHELRGIRPACDVSRLLDAFAKVDLSERITGNYQGTFAQLKADAADTAAQLSDVVAQIRDAS
ncbi:MAG: hypothetical protein ABIU95_06800, partial [Burkholderiales bacterium]